VPLNLLGFGSIVRGTTGDGVLNRLGVHLGIAMVGDFAVIIVNIILGIIFGAVGGLLYAAALGEKASTTPSGISRPRGKTTLGKR
jgi:hypothetical protein